MKIKHFVLFLLLFPVFTFSQVETLDVLKGWYKYDNLDHALYHHYLSQALKLIDKRKEKIKKLNTIEEWKERQKEVKKILPEIIGPFPDKTPLNAKVVGIIQKNDYHIEKIIFESRPNYLVPAFLFVPNNINGKVPGILFPMGHNQKGIRADYFQRSAINMVKKGFVVLTFDPIGQGERSQFYSRKLNKSVIGGGCLEHMYASLPVILTGRSLANYFIWDGIRALDYLLSRKEVDSTRIGITGLSGGATATTFGAAYDSRIKAAAPSCFISSMKRVFESIGPQGPEQNLIGALARGIDYPDYIEVRAPKPFLALTTTRDFLSIQGARETEAEVKKVYKIFDAEDNFLVAEDDSIHAITTKNRVERHKFFQKFLNMPGDPTDMEVNIFSDKELQITKTGQIMADFKCENILDVNKKDAKKLINKLNKARKNSKSHLQNVVIAAKKLTGYVPPEKVENNLFNGRYQKSGYVIERRLIDGEDGDYPVPFLLFLPDSITKPPVLYLNEAGKSADAEGTILSIVKNGHPVIAADLLTIGEMKQKSKKVSFGENAKYGSIAYSNYFAAVQLNRSLIGIHAGDIERLVKYIKQSKWFSGNDIYAVAKGELLSASLLHAAVFEKEFSKIILSAPLISYAAIAGSKLYYSPAYSPIVPGALTAYDLPDLEAVLAPTKLLLVDVRNEMNKTANKNLIESELNIVKETYKTAKAVDNFVIENNVNEKELFENWFNK